MRMSMDERWRGKQPRQKSVVEAFEEKGFPAAEALSFQTHGFPAEMALWCKALGISAEDAAKAREKQ